MRIPNSFSGMMFNRSRIQFESGALSTEFSYIYFILPSITDRLEDIKKYIGSVNLNPIDIPEDSFKIEGGKFAPSKLDFENSEKEKMQDAVLKVLEKVVDLSNANIVKNSDGLLATRCVNPNNQWMGETGKHVSENRYALSN